MSDLLFKRTGQAALLACLLSGSGLAYGSIHIHPPSQEPLLSQQISIVGESIKADAEQCAAGEGEGSIGSAIKNALKIHTELAAAMPNTEELFAPVKDCFADLLAVNDLSFAIPSLASIRDAVGKAMLKFAQKKVCSAVDEVRTMVTGPLNQAIGSVTGGTGMSGLGDLNGLSNGLINRGMAMIDPQLGAEYTRPPASATYAVDLNPFATAALDFGGSIITPPPVAPPAPAPAVQPQARANVAPPAAAAPAPSKASGNETLTQRLSNLIR